MTNTIIMLQHELNSPTTTSLSSHDRAPEPTECCILSSKKGQIIIIITSIDQMGISWNRLCQCVWMCVITSNKDRLATTTTLGLRSKFIDDDASHSPGPQSSGPPHSTSPQSFGWHPSFPCIIISNMGEVGRHSAFFVWIIAFFKVGSLSVNKFFEEQIPRWLDAHKYTFQTHAVTIFTKLCVKGRLHNYLDTSCSPLAIQVFNPSKAFKLFMIFFFFSKLDVVDIQATKRVRCHFESKTWNVFSL